MKPNDYFFSTWQTHATPDRINGDNSTQSTALLSKGPLGFLLDTARIGLGKLQAAFLVLILTASLAVPKATAAQSLNLNELISTLPNILSAPIQLDLRPCEKQSDVEYFAHAGCPGYLTALREMNVRALQNSRAQVVLYLDGLISPLYGEKTFFVQGASFMHALPPRLPIKLKMLKLRTPEVIGLQLQDTLRMADRVVTPLLSDTSGDPVTQLRNSMRQLGIDPLPSTVMPMLGAHDSYLLQLWAQEDPDGLADFMHRVQAVIDQL